MLLRACLSDQEATSTVIVRLNDMNNEQISMYVKTINIARCDGSLIYEVFDRSRFSDLINFRVLCSIIISQSPT